MQTGHDNLMPRLPDPLTPGPFSRVGFSIKTSFEPQRHEEKHQEGLQTEISCPETVYLTLLLIV